MMHATIYCDGENCTLTQMVNDLGYDGMDQTIRNFLASVGWETSRFEGRTYHYCSSCAAKRKEALRGGVR
jgi:hypothetical protein